MESINIADRDMLFWAGSRNKFNDSNSSDFIVNEDLNATAQDVRDLIHEIKTRAKKEYNIDMVTEVEQLYW